MSSEHPDAAKGRRPFPTLRPPSSIAHSTTPANPAIPPEQMIPHRNVQPIFRISTTYSTIAARALSFQGRVVTGVTPLQLAQNGVYYGISEDFGESVCCFACSRLTPLYTFQRTPIEKALLHQDDCIWKIIYQDVKTSLKNPAAPSNSTNVPPPFRQLNPDTCFPRDRQLSGSTTSNSNVQSQNQSTTPALTRSGETPSLNVDSLAEPSPTRPPPEQVCSSRPFQPTPTTISSSQSQQPTYAAVLQHPTSTSSQSAPNTHQSAPPPNTTLTIDDLHRRFHNKPSPFELDKKIRKRPAKQVSKKAASGS